MHRAQGLAMIAFQLDRLASLQAELGSIQSDASSLLPAPALGHLSDSITSWTDADTTAPSPDDSSLYHTTTSFMPAEEGHEAASTAPVSEPGHDLPADASDESSQSLQPVEDVIEEAPSMSEEVDSAAPGALPLAAEPAEGSFVAAGSAAVAPASKAVDVELQSSPDLASVASMASGMQQQARQPIVHFHVCGHVPVQRCNSTSCFHTG